MLAHGAVLRKSMFSARELEAIARDYRNAGLAPDEVAVMSVAKKVSMHAHEVTAEDLQELRSHGLPDEEIMDVVLAAAARSFFSKTLDAVGIEPDEVYLELEPALLEALCVGRPFHGKE